MKIICVFLLTVVAAEREESCSADGLCEGREGGGGVGREEERVRREEEEVRRQYEDFPCPEITKEQLEDESAR